MFHHNLVLLHHSNLVSNLLIIYASRRLLPLLKSISRDWTRDHLYGLTGYKGTIAAQLLFKDNSSVVFMTSHFFPGEKVSSYVAVDTISGEYSSILVLRG